MFQAINLDYLTNLRLKPWDGDDRTCRLAHLQASDDETDALVDVVEFASHQVVRSGTLREVAREFWVESSENGNPESSAPREPLGDHLDYRCAQLKSNWPRMTRWLPGQGKHLLAGLLSPGKPRPLNARSHTWLAWAEGFLQVESALAAADAEQTPRDFFALLREQLEIDRRLWQPREGSNGKPGFSLNLRLEPQPKPLTFLKELQQAVSEARLAEAAARPATAGVLPYIQAAAEHHWRRFCSDSDLIKELSKQAATDVTRISVSIGRSPRDAPAPNGQPVAEVRGEQNRELCVQLDLPFFVRTGRKAAICPLMARLVLVSTAPEHPVKPSARFGELLVVFLNDLRWALDRCLAAETVSHSIGPPQRVPVLPEFTQRPAPPTPVTVAPVTPPDVRTKKTVPPQKTVRPAKTVPPRKTAAPSKPKPPQKPSPPQKPARRPKSERPPKAAKQPAARERKPVRPDRIPVRIPRKWLIILVVLAVIVLFIISNLITWLIATGGGSPEQTQQQNKEGQPNHPTLRPEPMRLAPVRVSQPRSTAPPFDTPPPPPIEPAERPPELPPDALDSLVERQRSETPPDPPVRPSDPPPRQRVDLSVRPAPFADMVTLPPPAPLPPLPTAAELRSAEPDVKSYEDRFRQAGRQDNEIAKFLYDMALQPRQKAEQYALLGRAREMIADAGWPRGVLAATESMAQLFDIDRASENAHFLERAFEKATTSEQRADAIHCLREEYFRALKNGNFSGARDLAQAGLDRATNGKMVNTAKQFQSYLDRVETASKSQEDAREAAGRLASYPQDADANAAVGRHLCLYQGDWLSGLPHLAKGPVSEIQKLAAAELEIPRTAAEQLSLATRWLALASSFTGLAGEAIRRRALRRFKQIVPYLDAEQKSKVDPLIRQLEAALAD